MIHNPDNDKVRRDGTADPTVQLPRNRWRPMLVAVAGTVVALAVYNQYRQADASGPPVPSLSMWVTSTGRTQAGPFLDVTHPFTWRAVVASPTQPVVTYNSTDITPDSGSLSLLLPDQSGLFVFGMDSAAASTTADEFVTSKVHALARGELVNSPAQKLSDGVYQAELRTADGSPTGMMHVVIKPQAGESVMLWRMFLGDAPGNALAIQIAMDSLHVRNK